VVRDTLDGAFNVLSPGLKVLTVNESLKRIAENLVLPKRGDVVVSYDGYGDDEERAATPDPLMGVFPLDYPLTPAEEKATLDFYLAKADDYVGSPMLSALCGVWAARTGDRKMAARLLEEGYAAFMCGRFLQTLEYRRDRFPEQPIAGPFFANVGGFLMSFLLGFPGLVVRDGAVEEWAQRPVVLPLGWDAIEVDRFWVRGRPARLSARHGESRAKLEFC